MGLLACEVARRPADDEFDAREWNLLKPVLALGTATGEAQIIQALIGIANTAYHSKTDSLNETSVENVILRCLLEIVWQENWYEFDSIHENIIQ